MKGVQVRCFEGEKRCALQLRCGPALLSTSGLKQVKSTQKPSHTRCAAFWYSQDTTYNGQEGQQRILGRRHGVVRVRMIGPAGHQHPLGLVLVVHLLERHGCGLN